MIVGTWSWSSAVLRWRNMWSEEPRAGRGRQRNSLSVLDLVHPKPQRSLSWPLPRQCEQRGIMRSDRRGVPGHSSTWMPSARRLTKLFLASVPTMQPSRFGRFRRAASAVSGVILLAVTLPRQASVENPGGLPETRTSAWSTGASVFRPKPSSSETDSFATPSVQARRVVFSSDWSTARGRSREATLDRGKEVPWDGQIGNGRLSEVISSEGFDFPSPNVLRVEAGWRVSPPGAAAQNHRLLEENGRIPVPSVGEGLFYRWYIRVVVPDDYAADTRTHPIQDASNGSRTNWSFNVMSKPAGLWSMWFDVGGNRQNAWPNNHWNLGPSLKKHQTYRVEVRVHRSGTATFSLHARVYDSGNQLLYDDSDFRNTNRSASLATGLGLRFNDVNRLAGFQVGFNGLNGGRENDYPIVLYYQGCVAVCVGDWCGPYANGQ